MTPYHAQHADLFRAVAEPEPHFDSEQKQGTYDSPIDQDGSHRWVDHVICEGSREHVLWWDSHGEHCSEPRCIINKPAEPEPCESAEHCAAKVFESIHAENGDSMIVHHSWFTIRNRRIVAGIIASYASQVADKRAEALRAQVGRLRDELDYSERRLTTSYQSSQSLREEVAQLKELLEEYRQELIKAKEALAATGPKR